MDPEPLRIAVLGALVVAGALWLLWGLAIRVSGTWERVLSDDDVQGGARSERITFGQLGPFITGRRDVAGGYQEFSGFLVGKTLRLTRRDHGPQALVTLGFPAAIAQQLDGEVTARLTLKIVEGGAFLEGEFVPQKVEFTHQPPRITKTYFLAPQPRRYRRVIPVEQTVPAVARRALVEDIEPT